MGYRSPRLVTIPICSGSSTPNDSTVYYVNNYPTATISTTEANRRYYLGLRGIIREVYCEWFCTVANGTAEAIPCSVRLNNTTDYAVSSPAVAANHRIFSNTNLNIPIVETDFFNIKFDCPGWVNNPDGVYVLGHILIEVS